MRTPRLSLFPAVTLILCVFLISAPSGAAAKSAEDAARFIESLADTAVEELADTSRSEEERAERFSHILDDAFAVEAISRFVLGRYWRAASEEERERFISAFQSMVLQRFLPLFENYSQDDYEVRRARTDPNNPDLFLVESRISDPESGQMVPVTWRVRPTEGSFEIIDVVAEGVSMAITLRSEYGSVIQRAGGLLPLIEQIERNVERGAYRPEEVEGLVQ